MVVNCERKKIKSDLVFGGEEIKNFSSLSYTVVVCPKQIGVGENKSLSADAEQIS